jgi:hypothetical protein
VTLIWAGGAIGICLDSDVAMLTLKWWVTRKGETGAYQMAYRGVMDDMWGREESWGMHVSLKCQSGQACLV